MGLPIYGSDNCGRPDLDGLSAFVYACAEADLELVAKLLMAITPREVAATINKTETVHYETVSDVSQDLRKMGVRLAVTELFRVDFSGQQADEVDADDWQTRQRHYGRCSGAPVKASGRPSSSKAMVSSHSATPVSGLEGIVATPGPALQVRPFAGVPERRINLADCYCNRGVPGLYA